MNKRRMRQLAETNPSILRAYIAGARQRELAARHLLLHPEVVRRASQEDLAALEEYLCEQRWRSLYQHDRRMYRLLRQGAEKLKGLKHVGASAKPDKAHLPPSRFQ